MATIHLTTNGVCAHIFEFAQCKISSGHSNTAKRVDEFQGLDALPLKSKLPTSRETCFVSRGTSSREKRDESRKKQDVSCSREVPYLTTFPKTKRRVKYTDAQRSIFDELGGVWKCVQSLS